MQVWAVLKPGFLAFLDGPFDTKLLDIVVFDVLPASGGNGKAQVYIANHMKERNLLRYAFRVSELFLSLLHQHLKILIMMLFFGSILCFF
jgi:hypothetical protein